MKRRALVALLSHWKRHPLQAFALIAGLALATALWSGVQAINAEARASYDRAADVVGAPGLDRIEGPLDQQTYVALRRAGWPVSPVLEGDWQGLRLIGVDPLTAPPGNAVAVGDLEDPSAFLRPPGAVVVGPDTRIEAEVRLLRSEDVPAGVAYADIGIAQGLLGRPGAISYLVLTGPLPRGAAELGTVSPELARAPGGDGQSDVARLTDSFHLNLTAFGLLSAAVGIFIVYSAISLAFEQRRTVVRTLRALGVPLRDIVGLLAVELLGLALIAGAIGIALGYAIAAALLPDVAATLSGLYGADVPGAIRLRPVWWLSGLGIAILGTGLAATGAVLRLLRMPILETARPEAWRLRTQRTLRRMAVGGVLLLGLSAALGVAGQGLIAGFAMLASLLVGAALLLPLILDTILGLAAHPARAPLARWFWADGRQQVPGLSMALMALLLAMAANIGVSTMVSSFRLTFTGWLDQRLASELYVRAQDAGQAQDLVAWLEPRATAVLPIVSVETRIAGLPADIFGVADHPTYRDNWPLLSAVPGVWDRVAEGEGVLINEQLSRRLSLAPGDTLPEGERVLGIYSDYGNPAGQLLVGLETFRDRYPQVAARQFGVRVPPERAEALAQEITATFALGPDGVVDQAGIKAFSLRIFERTFTVTRALNVLTLAVAGFAILMSLLTLAGMRLPQLAPLWAMGVTTGRLARLELLRAVALAAVVAVLSLPLGLALAWVLLAVVNVEAFGWRLPMYLFWPDYVELWGWALVAAALAAAWPALRMARLQPGSLLRVFSQER